MRRASIKTQQYQKSAHNLTLPGQCAQINIHHNIGIDSCNADTDHVASQPGIDQGMANQ